MQRQQEYVLRTVEERGVRFVRLWFTDVLGFLKSFAITPAELESAFANGMRFDGSAINGFSRDQESDMLAQPDPTTFQILPFRSGDGSVARMFCDIVTPDGASFQGDPRWVLRRNLERARSLGYTRWSTSTSPTAVRIRESWIRADTSISHRWMLPRSIGGARSSPWNGLVSRWNLRITRYPLASTRSICATPTR